MPHYETCADKHGSESFGTIEHSSINRSRLDLISEDERCDLMYALPMEECFNLIHYESKPSIDPLAQVVPSLNTKSKQIPRVSLVSGSNKNRPKNRASDHDILANKMTSFSSFKKKHSNQIARNKLSNYINTKKFEPKTKDKVEKATRLKIDISPKVKAELKHCGSSDNKAFESTSVM